MSHALLEVPNPQAPIRARRPEPVHCAICGPARYEPFGVSNGIRIVQCKGCGLYHVEERASESAVADFYRDDYISDQHRAEVQMISHRKSSLRRESRRLRNMFPDGAQLLDIGAASGTFLRQFEGVPNWQVEGVEPSDYAVRFARDRFGLTIHHGFLHEQRFNDASFDVVTSLDTFMLHPNPNEDLDEIHRILRPGGLFAAEIPGLTFRMLKNSGVVCRVLYGVPVSLNAGVHLYYYSRETLSRLAGMHGFELVASWAEQMPESGNTVSRFSKWSYYAATNAAYRLTGGRFHLAPKEFLIFRRVEGLS